MPSRLQALIVSASLTGAAFSVPAAAMAQSAGDDQYQDPAQTQTTPSATPPDPSAIPQLSPSTTSTSPTTPAAPTTTPPKPPSRPLPSELPNTGLDGRILAGIGVGMLLCGIGLRLRTTRERF